MANKSMMVHYMNKYPGGRIDASQTDLVVYCKEGMKSVHLQKDGMNNWVDRSEEMGCVDKHDLGALPKVARVWKLHEDGKIAKAEEGEERAEKMAAFEGRMVPGAQGKNPPKGISSEDRKNFKAPSISDGGFSHEDAQKMSEVEHFDSEK